MPELFKHQKECLEFLEGKEFAAILLPRGVGKTPAILVFLNGIATPSSIFLYVAPLSTLGSVANECRSWAPLVTPILLAGSRDKKLKMAREAVLATKNSLGAQMVIVNYESLRTMSIELAIMPAAWDAVVCDESTRIKERRAQQSKACALLGKAARRRFIMTGMPVSENLIDAYSQYSFLANGRVFNSNFYAFRNRYVVMGGYQNKEIKAYRNVPEFMSRIAPFSFAKEKSECIDLPPKMFQQIDVDLSAEQAKVYIAVKAKVAQELEGGELTITSAIAAMTKLCQVTSGFCYLDDGTPKFFSESPKLAALLDVVETTPKVVVFGTFIAEIEMISRFLSVNKICHIKMVSGDSAAERTEKIAKFQSDKESRVFLSDVRIGSVGVTLTAADTLVFHSNPWSLEFREQGQDRVWRYGSGVHQKITIVDILARGTVDEAILKALTSKRKFAESIIAGVLGERAVDKLKGGDGDQKMIDELGAWGKMSPD